jgi:hypothetical protein
MSQKAPHSLSALARVRRPMPDPADKLTPADPDDLAAALAFALKFDGRKRQHDAERIHGGVRYLERARYVVMKRPPLGWPLSAWAGF